MTVSHAYVPYGHDQKAIRLSSDQETSLEIWGDSRFFHFTVFFFYFSKLKIERTKHAINGNTNLTHVVAEEEYNNLQWYPLKSVSRLPQLFQVCPWSP